MKFVATGMLTDALKYSEEMWEGLTQYIYYEEWTLNEIKRLEMTDFDLKFKDAYKTLTSKELKCIKLDLV
jgi:hypothetical protein